MKPTVVADEMFPEGAGPYMDLEEVTWKSEYLPVLRNIFQLFYFCAGVWVKQWTRKRLHLIPLPIIIQKL
jgi:hypothetical protein